jgi:hypothetical protein
MREISRQQHGSFLLTGFYLSEEQLREVEATLTPDVPPIGAVGRWHDVPVYRKGQSSADPVQQSATIRGLTFTYFLEDARCPLNVSLGLVDLEQDPALWHG